eukprot:9947870-Alexandrium_andersonii.AAC.1
MVPVISRTAEVTERAVDFFIGSSVRDRKRINMISDGAGEFPQSIRGLIHSFHTRPQLLADPRRT